MDEQVKLIQQCMYPLILTVLTSKYDAPNRKYNFFNLTPEEEAAILSRFPPYRQLVPSFHAMGQCLHKLRLDDTEVAFLCAMLLISEGNYDYQPLCCDAMQTFILKQLLTFSFAEQRDRLV